MNPGSIPTPSPVTEEILGSARDFQELSNLGLSRDIWSLIQRGLNHAGFYRGTYKGKPGPKTRAALDAYLRGEASEPDWLAVARGEMGVKEYAGAADNPDVVKYLKSVESLSRSAQRNDETPWCSAFVNWCMEQAGLEGTDSAAARSWMSWGSGIDVPVEGCVTVLWRDSPDSWKGHVGFLVRETSSYVYLLGGNQSDEVNITKYSKRRVLGYRVP